MDSKPVLYKKRDNYEPLQPVPFNSKSFRQLSSLSDRPIRPIHLSARPSRPVPFNSKSFRQLSSLSDRPSQLLSSSAPRDTIVPPSNQMDQLARPKEQSLYTSQLSLMSRPSRQLSSSASSSRPLSSSYTRDTNVPPSNQMDQLARPKEQSLSTSQLSLMSTQMSTPRSTPRSTPPLFLSSTQRSTPSFSLSAHRDKIVPFSNRMDQLLPRSKEPLIKRSYNFDLIQESTSKVKCPPRVLNILSNPGGGHCLFYSLLAGLIRLKIENFENMNISTQYSIKYLHDNIMQFRNEIVTWLRQNLDTPTIIKDPTSMTFEAFIKNSYPKKTINSYLASMASTAMWGDEVIIQAFRNITKINIVLVRRAFKGNGKYTFTFVGGNSCFDGIWLNHHYDDRGKNQEGGDHFELIFPIEVNNNYLKIKDEIDNKIILLQPPLETITDSYEQIIIQKGVHDQMVRVQEKTDHYKQFITQEGVQDQVARPTLTDELPDGLIGELPDDITEDHIAIAKRLSLDELENEELDAAILKSLEGQKKYQKYFTYKNNFNQSKYYEKYLKYKLKYNQLKEKLN